MSVPFVFLSIRVNRRRVQSHLLMQMHECPCESTSLSFQCFEPSFTRMTLCRKSNELFRMNACIPLYYLEWMSYSLACKGCKFMFRPADAKDDNVSVYIFCGESSPLPFACCSLLQFHSTCNEV